MNPETKFGIKGAGRYGARTFSQKFALVASVAYIGIGVVGFFVTGFANVTEESGTALLGIFYLNPYHNLVHIAIGALWLLGALLLSPSGTEGVNIAIGSIYVLAAVLGTLGYLSLLNVRPGADPDNFLHIASGLLPLLLGSGIIGGARSREAVPA